MVWLESLSCMLALLCEKSRDLFFHICSWKETENVCVHVFSQAKRAGRASQAFKIDLNTDSELQWGQWHIRIRHACMGKAGKTPVCSSPLSAQSFLSTCQTVWSTVKHAISTLMHFWHFRGECKSFLAPLFWANLWIQYFFAFLTFLKSKHWSCVNIKSENMAPFLLFCSKML